MIIISAAFGLLWQLPVAALRCRVNSERENLHVTLQTGWLKLQGQCTWTWKSPSFSTPSSCSHSTTRLGLAAIMA